MYDILEHEFAAEKRVKAEANKIDIGTFNSKVKSETKGKTPKKEEVKEPAEETEIPIQTPKTETISEHIEIAGPKIIGHIDLEHSSASKKNVPEPEPEPEPKLNLEPEPEQKSEPVPVKEPEAEPKKIEVTIEKPKVLGKIDLIKNGKGTKNDHGSKGKETPSTSTLEASSSTEPASTEPTVEPMTKLTTEPIVEPSEEPVQPIDDTPKENTEPQTEHIETKHVKLTGPTIITKIEINTTPKKVEKKVDKKGDKNNKKPDNNSKPGEGNKKSRKKIYTQKSGDIMVKPGNTGKNNGKAQKETKPEEKELTKGDIQKSIKETKKRMEQSMGNKKTSAKHRKAKRQMVHERFEEEQLMRMEDQKILRVTEFLTVSELATMMNKQPNDVVRTCMSIGLFVSINQRLDAETISMLAEEFGFQYEFIGADEEDMELTEQKDAPEDLVPRHPIVTVMGHVDHGKTSLLDYIRKTNVIAGEAGGITQHIGAYKVTLSNGRQITFLDTPGHEAFTAMRARGARITDLCIIVVAADDAVMPQTIEAINHAQAAGVPMVFAITKIDKPNANPDRILQELANMNILVEEWGGKYQCQQIDAKHGTNVKELLEKVLLEADLLDLRANPNRPGVGTVIESALDKGRGYIAKVLVQNGSLSIGDPILAGSCFGKVKAMFNERNQTVKTAGPATPVLLLGLNGAPQAGDSFKVCETEQEARSIASKRQRLAREMGLRTQKHITLEEIGRRIAIGDFKEFNIIVKGDVDGSIEALSGELLKLSTEQVQVNIIHKSVGAVTETDVMLATASNAIIVAFQVRPTAGARKAAEAEQIDIRTYSIIYTAINEIKEAIAGMHSPEIREKVVCNIEVREVFHISKVGNIAGCIVLDGKLQRSTKIRLIRDGIVIYTGSLGSLRRFKDDVKEVVSGQDCGLNIDGCNDIKVGDIIEGYEEYEVAYRDK